MGEGFRPSIESRTERSMSEIREIERLVAQQWEAISRSHEAFKEKEAEDALDPERFMAETMQAWEKQEKAIKR